MTAQIEATDTAHPSLLIEDASPFLMLQEELMPGVPLERAHIIAKGTPPEVDRRALMKTVETVNHTLTREAHTLPSPGDAGEHMTRLLTEDETETVIGTVVDHTRDMATSDLAILVITPMAGAAPVGNRLLARGVNAFPIDIRSTDAANTGTATIVSAIPEGMLDPNRTIVVCDDIGDSWGTVIAVALRRQLERLGYTWLPKDPTTHDLANLLRVEHVIPYPVFNKHPSMIEALLDVAREHPETQWSRRIRSIYTEYHGNLPPRWVLGGGMLDTGVRLPDVIDDIFLNHLDLPENLRTTLTTWRGPTNPEWTAHNHYKLRIGWPIPGIVYLDGDGRQQSLITHLVAETLVQFLTNK